jgi:hypothetical protein
VVVTEVRRPGVAGGGRFFGGDLVQDRGHRVP